MGPGTGLAGGVAGADAVVVGGGGGEVGVCVGGGGEVVAADLLPASVCVPPGDELVAGGVGDLGPGEGDGGGCGLGAKLGGGEVGVGGGEGLLGPGAVAAAGVEGADAVVVGGADGEAGMVEGGGGEVVAADLLPAGVCVPPGDELVAVCAGDFGPGKVDGGDGGLGGQGGRGELGGGRVGEQEDGGDGQEEGHENRAGSPGRESHFHAPDAERLGARLVQDVDRIADDLVEGRAWGQGLSLRDGECCPVDLGRISGGGSSGTGSEP